MLPYLFAFCSCTTYNINRKGGKGMKVISVKIPNSDNTLLDRLAIGNPDEKAALVRDAIRQYCAKKISIEKRKDTVIDEVFGVFKHAPLDAAGV